MCLQHVFKSARPHHQTRLLQKVTGRSGVACTAPILKIPAETSDLQLTNSFKHPWARLKGADFVDKKMIKLEPLSGLLSTEEVDDNARDHTRDKKDKKNAVLPQGLLDAVTHAVQAQVASNTFVDEQPSSDPEMSSGQTAVVSAEITERREELLQTGRDNGHVYDISVLFSGKLDRAFNKPQAAKKSTKKRKKNSSTGQEDENHEADQKKPRKMVPNHFISIQITDPEIHAGLRNVQQRVTSEEPRLSPAMIPLPTLHLTVLVMHLADEEEIGSAKSVLTLCGQKLQPKFDKPFAVEVTGLDNFGHSVVFATVRHDPSRDKLLRVADEVKETFTSSGVNLAGEKGFKPHITAMKLSRAPILRKKGIKKICSTHYAEFAEKQFGTQVVERLQLCAMMGPKDENGYYRVLHSVPIAGSGTNQGGNVFRAELERELKWSFTEGSPWEAADPSRQRCEVLTAADSVVCGKAS